MQNKRMTDEEYSKCMAELLDKIQATSTSYEDDTLLLKRYRQAEFDLMIEYRLGSDFPTEKREKLQIIHEQLLKKTEELRNAYAEGKLNHEQLLSGIQDLSHNIKEQYSQVLTEEEVALLLGKEQQDIPFLHDETVDS